MNDALWSWFSALSGPLNVQSVPRERVADADDVERLAGVRVDARALVDEAAPNQYSMTSFDAVAGARQRPAAGEMAGDDEHCWLSNGS